MRLKQVKRVGAAQTSNKCGWSSEERREWMELERATRCRCSLNEQQAWMELERLNKRGG